RRGIRTLPPEGSRSERGLSQCCCGLPASARRARPPCHSWAVPYMETLWRPLLRARHLKNETAGALSGLDGGQLAVPLVDHGALDLQAAQFQKLRRQRALPDAVGFGFTLGAIDLGLGIAFRFGNFLGGFGLRHGQFVACAFGVLDGASLGG